VAYFSRSGRLLVEMSQLASLSESARTIALERFRILQPHIEHERFLTQVARDAGIPYRTAQRWVMQYRKYGLIGLTRGEREDSGSRRALSPNLREVVEALALQKPPLPIAALHRQSLVSQRNEENPSQITSLSIGSSGSCQPIWCRSPDAEHSTMRIVLRTSASNSASALPGSWKYSW
jgi:hypothetical protein